MKNPHLPNNLLDAIQKELQHVPRNKLAAAAKDLSAKYRSQEEQKGGPLITTDVHRLAYMAVRLPATFASVSTVLYETQKIIPTLSPKSLNDIGCGPGTASFACLAAFPSLESIHFFEVDAAWISIGKRLLASYPKEITSSWSNVDASRTSEFPVSDVSIVSYAIGELTADAAANLVKAAWTASSQLLIIIEPGTPRGFSYINAARDLLIQNGAFIVAPCPHQHKCPMQHPDWCHFSCRLNRTEMHLEVKEVDRGFEDEKFSYIVAARAPAQLPDARILRHPEHHSGHTSLVLCTRDGIKKETISRKQGPRYKAAKKASWGDTLADKYDSALDG